MIVHSGAGGDTNEEAIKWLERAAANSHVDAMAFLGGLYARGDGVAKMPEKALEQLSNAAKLGHPRAEYELGLCFLNGEGVVQNDPQSFYPKKSS